MYKVLEASQQGSSNLPILKSMYPSPPDITSMDSTFVLFESEEPESLPEDDMDRPPCPGITISSEFSKFHHKLSLFVPRSAIKNMIQK